MQTEEMRRILDAGVIAIVRGVSPDRIVPTVEGLLRGGIATLEITFGHADRRAVEESLESMRRVSAAFGGQVQMGAGTVLSCENAREAAECGARFMISPHVDAEVIRYTKEIGCLSFPGAMTPTEAVMAAKAGADAIKLFPAGELGAGYLKAIRAPLAHLKFLAVGGISPENMAAFLDAGACGFGVGGKLVDLKAIHAGEYDRITETAKAYTRAWKQYWEMKEIKK